MKFFIKILLIGFLCCFLGEIHAQNPPRIAKGQKDFYQLLRQAIGKREGVRQPIIKLFPVSSDSLKYFMPSNHGLNAKRWKNSSVTKGWFDFDPFDSTQLSILIDADLLIRGLQDAGFQSGNGGGESDGVAISGQYDGENATINTTVGSFQIEINEFVLSLSDLSGVAPTGAGMGINITTGRTFYVDNFGNWQILVTEPIVVYGTFKTPAEVNIAVPSGGYYLTDPLGVFGCAYCLKRQP